MAICLHLESIDREILQMKIYIFWVKYLGVYICQRGSSHRVASCPGLLILGLRFESRKNNPSKIIHSILDLIDNILLLFSYNLIMIKKHKYLYILKIKISFYFFSWGIDYF